MTYPSSQFRAVVALLTLFFMGAPDHNSFTGLADTMLKPTGYLDAAGVTYPAFLGTLFAITLGPMVQVSENHSR